MFSVPELPKIPPALARVVAAIADGGHDAWLGGEELALSWWAPAASEPRQYRILTSASATTLLQRFRHAVPTQPSVFLIPSSAGPIDVVVDQSLPDALADFGFSLFAVAWDLASDRAIDPHSGLEDIRSGRLRAVGDSAAIFERTPLLALRALRLVSELGLTVDREIEAALGSAPVRTTPSLRTAGRSELLRAVCGPHAGAAFRLASTSGLLKKLADLPSANPGIGSWLDDLPRRAELRLAIWLGRDAAPWLRDWRFGIERSRRVLELAQHHPIDEMVRPQRDASVGRLLQRLPDADRNDLIAAREAELASETLSPEQASRGRAGLAALIQAVARVEGKRDRAAVRGKLALSGDQVMHALGCGPGPRVGRALAHLAAEVAANPAVNTEANLRVALEEWVANSSD